jgi:hypothetical protein
MSHCVDIGRWMNEDIVLSASFANQSRITYVVGDILAY